MLGSQQFCVRWNSYQTNLQDVFPKLLNNEHFVDVTLACEAQMIKCHKVVLSACSTYFEQLLVQNPCQHPIIFMKDMKHWEVQALVDFMYKGEVNVSQEEISSLLKAAEALQIRGLCGADRQQDSNAVSLPPETTLSDSGGRETPPAKRRKFPEQQPERRDKQQSSAPTPKPSNSTPAGSSASATPTSSNNDLASVLGVSGPITASVTSTPFRETDRNNSSTETHSEEILEKSSIKKEHVEHEDSYFENDGDYESFDIQDDSNSMNPDISMPTSPLDQAGPSGMAGPQGSDKSAAGLHPASATRLQPENIISTPTFPATDYEHDAQQQQQQQQQHLHQQQQQGMLMGLGLSPGKARIRRSENELRQAAECVVKGSTFQTVSDRFGIPISTIRFYMARRGILPQRRRGRSSAASSMQHHFHMRQYPMPE